MTRAEPHVPGGTDARVDTFMTPLVFPRRSRTSPIWHRKLSWRVRRITENQAGCDTARPDVLVGAVASVRRTRPRGAERVEEFI